MYNIQSLYCGHRFSPDLSRLSPLSWRMTAFTPPTHQATYSRHKPSLACIARLAVTIAVFRQLSWLSRLKSGQHCKWRASENPIYMSGSHLCIPRNETVQPPYFQNIIIMLSLSIPTLILYICDSFIYFQDRFVYFAVAKYVDWSSEYIIRLQTHKCGNWDWGRAIPR